MDNLNEVAMEELEYAELYHIQGGIIGAIVAGVTAGLVISAIDHWSDIKSGVTDAWNDGTAMYN